MKTILVPTDFSEDARNAMYYAAHMAQQAEARIILLHAYETNVFSPGLITPQYYQAEEKKERHKWHVALKEEHNRLKKLFPSLPCEESCREGSVTETILKAAEDFNPHVIIMGTRGAGGLKKIFPGSNTANVIESVSCPVLAIPAGAHYKKIRRMVYAAGYHDFDTEVLKKLSETARLSGAEINVVHVALGEYPFEKEEEQQEMLKARVAASIHYGNISFRIIGGEDVAQELEKIMDFEQTDLLALTLYYHSWLEKIFRKNIPRELAHAASVPLMVMHHAGAAQQLH